MKNFIKILRHPEFWILAILFTGASIGMIFDDGATCAAGVLMLILDGGWIALKINEIDSED
jgi:hypothetical protein